MGYLREADVDGPHGDLRARGEVELGEDARHVRLHRPHAHHQLAGNGTVGLALGDQRGHLTLAPRQPAGAPRPRLRTPGMWRVGSASA